MTYKLPHPPIECRDGFTMSVQASSYHYCLPRQDDAPFYLAYEVGFPSAREELLMPYIEGAWYDEDREQDPCESVYPHVPVETVALIIRQHGGLK